MNTNDGGPAFPHDGQQNYTGGMTLRDYFAARAMQASMMHSLPCSATEMEGIARDCYYMADAMLKAREAA